MSNETGEPRRTEWRYEIRGSHLVDLWDDAKVIDLFTAGERLNEQVDWSDDVRTKGLQTNFIQERNKVTNLEQQLKTALEERDANAAKAALLDDLLRKHRTIYLNSFVHHKASSHGSLEACEICDALSNPVGKEGAGGVPSSEVQDA